MTNEIGQRIRMLRKTLGLSQEEFGKKLGVTLRTIARYERGETVVPDRTLRQIEQTFSVNPEWLREGKGEMFLPKKKELTGDPFEIAAEAVIDAIMEKKDIKLPPTKKRKLVKKLAELMKQIGEKEAIDLIDLAV
jgi:transcriptional regulator with XRE-family HTH domain